MCSSAFCGSNFTARSRPGILSPLPSYQAIAGLASFAASQPANTMVRARTTARLARDSRGTRTSRTLPPSHATGNRRVGVGVVIAVVIAIAVRVNVDVVENHTEQTGPDRDEAADGPLGGITARPAVTKDEHRALELAGQDHGVAHTEHRAGI